MTIDPEDTDAGGLDNEARQNEVRALTRGVKLRQLTDDELDGIIAILGPARLRVALQEIPRPVLRILDTPPQ